MANLAIKEPLTSWWPGRDFGRLSIGAPLGKGLHGTERTTAMLRWMCLSGQVFWPWSILGIRDEGTLGKDHSLVTGLGPKRSPWVTSPPLGLQWVLWALSPCVRRHLGLLWKSRGSSLEWRTSYHCSANMWAFNMFGRTPDIWTKVFFFPLQLLKRGQRIFLDPCLFIVQRLHSVIDLHIWK